MHYILKSCLCVFFLTFCSQLTVLSMDIESPLGGDLVPKTEGDRNFVKEVLGLGEEVARNGWS